ncbi:diaminopimelate epimerase [Halarsenatibacter silvermanii]|uniref:Diaminopimelate epimerase n=1 Tax=Halarsenatibacter silvermanii TaxID=321763 RepID=A0A1G9P091_9FIRM|nr:diaminopimelate epimerase [Halarsenatibacter silvermanii]SDL91667.1 diaminopimelate epimerase [Halarsenatibacter silvermanii]
MTDKTEFEFYKYQGLGNDFIIFNPDFTDDYDISPEEVRKLCDRNFGIGADGILLISPSGSSEDDEYPEFDLTIHNSDGSTAEMCGNGVRCIAHYLKDQKIIEKGVKLKTGAGEITPELESYDFAAGRSDVKVDMGSPEFDPDKIPVDWNYFFESDKKHKPRELFEVKYNFFADDDSDYRVNFVSMGNPHAVFFVEKNLESLPLKKWGPKIETHFIFPEDINVEFARIIERDSIEVRVWERGCGITLACGTGACAVAAAAVKKNLTEEAVNVSLPGGDLNIDWSDKRIKMTGPSRRVFRGTVDISR